MSFAWRIASFLTIALVAAAQSKSAQQSKSRDLKYEEDRPAVTPTTIPRGYALIVGVAGYKNLPANAQYHWSSDESTTTLTAAAFSVRFTTKGTKTVSLFYYDRNVWLRTTCQVQVR